MNVLFNNLKRHYDALAADLEAATLRVLQSGWYILGPEVTAFEQAWAEYCQAEYCISLASGTDALLLALAAVGVEAGDEVLTVANAGGYTSCAVWNLGAHPRYVDVDPQTLTMNPSLVEDQISTHTKALVVVHLYGCVADLTALREIADRHGIALIEDCAQAHGARFQDRPVGTIGDIGCFSFYPTKNLGALGDGGAVITNSAPLAERMRQLRTYGWGAKYSIELQRGVNSRLDEMQAALLQVKLRYLDQHNARRREIAGRYHAGLGDLDLVLPVAQTASDHIYHLYVIQLSAEQRDTVRDTLREQGIGCDVHYPIPDHQQPAWQERYQDVRLPITEAQAQTVLSLPCYPELEDGEIEAVIAAIRAICTY